MKIFIIIEYLAGAGMLVYFCGVVSVWVCEFKKGVLYKKMRQEICMLENFRISTAVFHAKTYKITEDYRRNVLKTEQTQRFILENVLMIRTSSFKTYPRAN